VAANDELLGFVRESLARGTSRAEIEAVLLRAGWSRDQVNTALDAYADVEFQIPVPKPKPYLSAREAFMYLLLFSTLYVCAYNLGVLIFDYINRAFPDPAVTTYYNEYTRQSVRWALSSLIVAFPVFLYLSSIVERAVRRDPGKRRSNVRRWLMYLTIFAAASILIGDFITLVYNVLGGELTTRFVLKVLTIAAIAGTIFGYYLSDLRLEDTRPVVDDRRRTRTVAAIAVASVAAVVLAGFFVMGRPAEERARRLDARRVDDLRGISNAAELYLDRHKRLPASLSELSAEGGTGISTHDPGGRAYEYRVTGERSYELCADFQRDSAEAGARMAGDFWSHGPGRRCFQLERKQSAQMR
jgi:hypothetical protein